MATNNNTTTYREPLHLEDLTGKDQYSCDVVAMVLKKWSSIEFCDLYVTDYTPNANLLDRRVQDGPPGRMTLKIESHHPHKTFAEHDLHLGHVCLFRNLKVKRNKSGEEIEATQWRDKFQPDRVNIWVLPKSDSRVQAVLVRKREFENPKSKSSGKPDRKRKRKQEAREERERAEKDETTYHVKEARNGAAGNHAGQQVEDQPAPERNGLPSEVKTTENVVHETENNHTGTEPDHFEQCKQHLELALKSAVAILDGNDDQSKLLILKQTAQGILKVLQPAELNVAKESQHNKKMKQDPLMLRPRKCPDPAVDEKLRDIFHSDAMAEKRRKPWLLNSRDKTLIEYPPGFEPRPECRTEVYGECSEVKNWVSLSTLKETSPAALPPNITNRAPLRVIDYHPDKLSRFVDSTEEFNFWLRCQGVNDDGWVACEVDVSVRGKDAETLLGITAREVVEGGASGVQKLRTRLNLLWGDLELLKKSLALAEPHRVQKQFWASYLVGAVLWPSGPHVQMGLVPVTRVNPHYIPDLDEIEWRLCRTRIVEG